jgi:thioredoxin 1
MVEKVTDATFDKDVLKASGPVVVDFWAEWCGPCRMIAPALEEISNSLNGKVKIVKLNVDENPGIAAKYGIMSIPTLMLFKDGQLASRQIGAQPKQKLEQWITASILCFCSSPAWDNHRNKSDRIAIEAAFGLSFSAIVIAKSPQRGDEAIQTRHVNRSLVSRFRSS